MGQLHKNVELVLDRPEGSEEALFQLRVHRGEPPVDDRSAVLGEAEFRALQAAAAEGPKAFAAAAAERLGDWFLERPQHHAAWRSLFLLGMR